MKQVAKNNLKQLIELLNKLNKSQYIFKPEVLYGASIGQHIRHILEFYYLLIQGAETGTICYDERERDYKLETNIEYTIAFINALIENIESLAPNKMITLQADYSENGEQTLALPSSISRELAYCIEHCIHHQALIKTALIAIGAESFIDNKFGIAYSTIRYRNESCAQ